MLILQDASQELEPFALKLTDNTRKDVGSATGFEREIGSKQDEAVC